MRTVRRRTISRKFVNVGRGCPLVVHLVAVEVVAGEQLVVAVLVERDDDQRDEDVEEEERKHDEVDDVEDGRVPVRCRPRTSLLHRRVHRHPQQPANSAAPYVPTISLLEAGINLFILNAVVSVRNVRNVRP